MTRFMFDSATGAWAPHPRAADTFVRPLITPDQNPGLTVTRVRLMPGAQIPPHTHAASTETFFVLCGVATCCVGGVEREMPAGHMGYAPPGVEHWVRNLGAEPVEALSIFNPPL